MPAMKNCSKHFLTDEECSKEMIKCLRSCKQDKIHFVHPVKLSLVVKSSMLVDPLEVVGKK